MSMVKIPRVLVVEDDPLFRDTLVDLLEGEGYDVVGMGDGEAALSVIESGFELIISDIRLPGNVDGMQIAKSVRKTYGERMGVIVITGYADANVPQLVRELNLDGCLYKPFQVEELLASVRRTIQFVRLEQELSQFGRREMYDVVTSLLSKSAFLCISQKEYERAKQFNYPLHLFWIAFVQLRDFPFWTDALRWMGERLQQSFSTLDWCFYVKDGLFFILSQYKEKGEVSASLYHLVGQMDSIWKDNIDVRIGEMNLLDFPEFSPEKVINDIWSRVGGCNS